MSEQRLFISYDSEDSAAVDRIVAYLEGHGAACWIASRDIPPRSIYAEAITQAMRDAEACIVIVSERANHSDAIKRELELASHYRKPFIPIRIDAAEPGHGLDYYLRNTQWINYARDGESALNRIVEHAAGASTAPVAPRAPTQTPRPSSGSESNSPGRFSLIALAAIALIAVGAVAWTNLNAPSTPADTVAAIATPDSQSAATAESDPQGSERERLQRERDEAFQAASAAEARLATERAQREAAERARLELEQREATARAQREATERVQREAAERARVEAEQREATERAQREATERAQRESAERARVEQAERARREAAERAARQSLVGTWLGRLQFSNGHSRPTAWAFRSDGTYVSTDLEGNRSEGTWTQNGDSVSWSSGSTGQHSGRVEGDTITGSGQGATIYMARDS